MDEALVTALSIVGLCIVAPLFFAYIISVFVKLVILRQHQVELADKINGICYKQVGGGADVYDVGWRFREFLDVPVRRWLFTGFIKDPAEIYKDKLFLKE